MCRHLAYLGPQATLRSAAYRPAVRAAPPVLGAPPAETRHGQRRRVRGGLVRPRLTRCPARYRRAGPMWGDASFADLVRVVRTGALLAAVRSATDGTAQVEAAAAPYAAGRGCSATTARWTAGPTPRPGWPPTCRRGTPRPRGARRFGAGLGAGAAPAAGGESPADALAGTVGDLDAAGITGRFNFLLTDGKTIAATAAGDTLCYRCLPGQVVVASEPFDDEPGWSAVPDRTVLTARPGVVDAGRSAPG